MLGNYPRLKSLHLSHCIHVEDKVLAEIAKICKQLTFLDIRGCNFVTDQGLLRFKADCGRFPTLLVNKTRLITQECLDSLNVIPAEYTP